MFTEDELEALMLGVRMVESWTDETLASAARQIVAKVESILPRAAAAAADAAPLFAPGFHVPAESARELSTLREAIRERRKLVIEYVDRMDCAVEPADPAAGALLLGHPLDRGRVVRAAGRVPRLSARSRATAVGYRRDARRRKRTHAADSSCTSFVGRVDAATEP